MVNGPKKIVRVFVNPDGSEHSRHEYEIPEYVDPEKFLPKVPSTPEAAIDEFVAAIMTTDHHRFERSMKLLDHTGAWAEAFCRVATDPRGDAEIGNFLHTKWVANGFRIRNAVDNDNVVIEALRALLLPFVGQGLTLYRGQGACDANQGSYGISWTRSLEVAEMFASRWRSLENADGVVLETIVPIEGIVVGPNLHSAHLGEFEYVFDVRMLNRVRVVKTFTPSAE